MVVRRRNNIQNNRSTTRTWMVVAAATGAIAMVHLAWSWNVYSSSCRTIRYMSISSTGSSSGSRSSTMILGSSHSHSYYSSDSHTNFKVLNATLEPFHTATADTVRRQQTIPTTTTTTRNLRFDWTRLERYSSLARRMADHQNNCNTSLATFRYRNRFGLGSDLHVYSQALCNALESSTSTNSSTKPWRVRTAVPWTWLDTEACHSHSRGASTTATTTTTTSSAMTCYFPESELTCDSDRHLSPHQENQLINVTRGRGRLSKACPTVLASATAEGGGSGVAAVRAATTEFLFTRVSVVVQHEAERQCRHVFGHDQYPRRITTPNASGTNTTATPHPGTTKPSSAPPLASNLITVHIRWGDKVDEMTLIPIHKYVEAVHELIQLRLEENSDWMINGVHILCATEDPQALQAFQEAAPRSWIIYVDYYYHEMLPYRQRQETNNLYNGNPLLSRELSGRPGLVALGSLLVSMEANSFVLTTSSNWSRLLNELRRNVLDPRCSNCTRWIDLSPGEW